MTVEPERTTLISKLQYLLEVFLIIIFGAIAVLVAAGGIFALWFVK